MRHSYTRGLLTALALGAVLTAGAQTPVAVATVTPQTSEPLTQFIGADVTFEGVSSIKSVEVVGDLGYKVYNPLDALSTGTPGYPMTAYLMPRGAGLSLNITDEKVSELQSTNRWPVADFGAYVITAPEGALKITDTAGTVYTNAAIELTYTLIPAQTPWINPDPAKHQNSLQKFAVTFGGFDSLAKLNAAAATLTLPSGDKAALEVSAMSGAIMLSAAEEYTEPGDYVLELAAGSFAMSNEEGTKKQYNPAVKATYTIGKDPTIAASTLMATYPEQGVVEQMGFISLTFAGVPRANKACTAPATISRDGVVLAELPTSNGAKIQGGVEGEAPEHVTLVFAPVREPYYEPGEYEVYIPGGFFLFGGNEASNEIKLKYTINPVIPAVFDPAPGIVEEIPSRITLTYEGVKSIKVNELKENEEGTGVIRVYTFVKAFEHNIDPVVTTEGNKVTFDLGQAYDAKGRYALVVPMGAFDLTLDNGKVYTSSSFNNDYIIPTIPEPTVNPAPGTVTADDLKKITLTLPEGFTYEMFAGTPGMYTVNPDGTRGKLVVSYDRTEDPEKPGKLISVRGLTSVPFVPKSEWTPEPGATYMLSMGKSCFACLLPDGTSSWNDCGYTYIYKIPEAPKYTGLTPDYESGYTLAELADINATFFDAKEVAVDPAAAAEPIAVINEETAAETGSLISATLRQGELNQEVTFTCTPAITDEGIYTFTIPEGYFTVDGLKSAALTLTYNVVPDSGVDGIADGMPAVADVYTADGIRVLRDATPAQVSALPAGLYIYGKRKVIVR